MRMQGDPSFGITSCPCKLGGREQRSIVREKNIIVEYSISKQKRFNDIFDEPFGEKREKITQNLIKTAVQN